jgi:hypothetical protein
MKTSITVTFDELEARTFDEVASPSILGGPEQDEKGSYPRLRLVRRAANSEPLHAVELAALKQSLEEAVAEREANVEEAQRLGSPGLADGFKTWLEPLGRAWALASEAETVALGGAPE